MKKIFLTSSGHLQATCNSLTNYNQSTTSNLVQSNPSDFKKMDITVQKYLIGKLEKSDEVNLNGKKIKSKSKVDPYL